MTRNILKTIAVVLGVLVLLLFIFKFFIVIEPGERVIIFNQVNGSMRVHKSEGMKFLVPFLERAYDYEIRSRTYTMSQKPLEGEKKGEDALQALTADGQNVFLDLSIRFHPEPKKLDLLHRKIGPDFLNRVIRPQVRSVTRMIVASFKAADVYSSQRKNIQDMIFKELKFDFEKNYIILDEVLLRNVQFSEEFQKAIEEKQIAQQETQRMKFILEKQELEKQRQIIEAQGDAEAIRLKGKALQENPSLIQYEYVKLLAPNIQAIVTDQNSIFNFSDFFKKQKKN